MMAKEQLKVIEEDIEFIADRKLGEHHAFIILPNSEFRKYWDISISMFVIYSLVVTPIQIAFPESSSAMDNMSWFDLMVDFFFLADIAFNFRTACLTNGAICLLEPLRYFTTISRAGLPLT